MQLDKTSCMNLLLNAPLNICAENIHELFKDYSNVHISKKTLKNKTMEYLCSKYDNASSIMHHIYIKKR